MNITRRDLFKRLGIGAALAAVGGVVAKALPNRMYVYHKSAVAETMLRAAEKAVDPPVMFDVDTHLDQITTLIQAHRPELRRTLRYLK